MSKRLEHMTEPEIGDLMTSLATELDRRLSEVAVDQKPMFVLLVFNDPRVAQYVSSCDRSMIPTALREAARRLERNEDVIR